MSELNDILKKFSSAPNAFLNKLSEVEKIIYGELLNAIKSMQTDRTGKIIANIENLKTIASIKVKIEKWILSYEYKSDVRDFVKEFQSITNLGEQYFNFSKLPNSNMFKAVKDIAIDRTLEALTGNGYKSTVVNKLGDLLVKSVTTGGNFNDLVESLRTEMLTTDKEAGILSRYARTYTTDALSQFHGQQMKLMSEGLKSQWYQYVGSNKTTTREFCLYLTKKEFVHISEFPNLIAGFIDGHQCEIYKKYNLPVGMIKGTNVDNLVFNKGGHSCDHAFIPLNELAVPEFIKSKFQS